MTYISDDSTDATFDPSSLEFTFFTDEADKVGNTYTVTIYAMVDFMTSTQMSFSLTVADS